MEHRWGYRRQFDRIVWVRTAGGATSRGCIRNVSISGAWVDSPLQLPALVNVSIQFRVLRAGRTATRSLRGQVVRVAQSGFAVEWGDVTPSALRAFLGDSIDFVREKMPSTVRE